MIYTKIISGLGNQLFQWAAARSLAEKHGTEVRLDISFYETTTFSYDQEFPRPFKLKRFKITAGIASPRDLARAPDFFRLPRNRRRWFTLLERMKLRRFMPRIREPSFAFHPHVLEAGDNVYLDGYWASENYFKAIAPIIREEAQIADEKIAESARQFVGQHRRGDAPVVGVQVRRGDVYYLHEVAKTPELSPTPLMRRDYFIRGMQHFGEHGTFLLFSDSDKDIQLCRQEFAGCKNITYVSGNDDITDFAILQACDHQIISNSTFGWWAAWLNRNPGKTIIAPQGWYAENSPHAGNVRDLIPPTWKLL